MIAAASSSLVDTEKEIASLIERLRDTEQRLEELTAGEVDSVASSDGRVFLLRHAQRNLRESEGAKQAAMLNALSAQVEAHRLAEDALRASDQRFRQMAENIQDVFFLNEVGTNRVLYVSPAYEKIWGRNCADLYANPQAWMDAIHPEDRSNAQEQYSRGIYGQAFEHEFRIVRPDGVIRVIEARGFPVSDAEGNTIRIAGVAEDVTERNRLEQAVNESERHFHFLDDLAQATRALSESGQVMTVMARMLGEHLNASRCAYADVERDGQRFRIKHDYTDNCASTVGHYELGLFGARALQTVTSGQTLVIRDVKGELSSEVGAEMFAASGIEAIIVCPVVREGRLRAMMAVQQTTPRDWSASEIAIVQEVVERCWSAIERRSAEEKQREGEALLRIAGSTAHMGGWAVNAADHSVTWSDEVCHMLEVPPGTVPELDQALNLYPMKSRSRIANSLEACLLGGTAFDLELEMLTAKGRTIWVRCAGEARRNHVGAITHAHGALQDITDRKLAETALGESERRFSDMLGNVQLVSVMLDAGGLITYCNDFILKLTGWHSSEVMGRNWFDLFVPKDQGELREVFAMSLVEAPQSWHRENEIITRAGERRLIRWNISVLRSATGEVNGTASIGEDITERKRAEISIKHLNRVYSVLRGINALIVRARDRDELFREACRIAVEAGGFRMSMICLIDQVTKKLVAVASAGKDDELMAAVRGLLASPETFVNTKLSDAIREKKPIVSNDWLRDKGPVLHEKYVQAGVRSLVVIPLIVAGEVTGVMALYAREADFFHEEEMKLLLELANDVAFAIDHIEKGEKLSYLAYYDSLTGLANRVLFHERLTQRVASARVEHGRVALVLMDIERFRTINDTFGREAGDALLKELAARMVALVADVGWLARIDGDHFAIMVPGLQEEEMARRIEQRVVEIFGEPFRVAESELRLSARFGVAMFPNDGTDADALFRNAEAALKNAKASGDRYLFYTNSMNERVAEKLVLENHLREAIEKQEFVLHYQPKIDLASGKLTGCEALIRWNDPRTGLVPPGKFIPVLEETGMIFEVGRWALRQALVDGLRWRHAGLPAVRVAVNVSPLQLRNRAFVAELRQLIGVDATAATILELEITEGMIMEDLKNSIATLQEIRAMGVTIAIDDFGTGFSSLSYLARLPVDTLKIDRSFVNDMNSGPVGLSLVSTIITLAHSVKLKVVAEGVETPEQSRLLGMLKCDEVQGFLYSKPVSGEEFEARFLAPSGAP
ncbi:MAG TPA: EAL domain-containing protein [Steroidobacteraceae bacterium]|nr:EAL domain-containing protein [Steroidobacteraceae bacterium]